MWAQLQRLTSQPEKQPEFLKGLEQLRDFEQPDSGLRRTLVLRSQADSSQVFVLVLFDSEEKARAREQDPRRREGLERLRAALPGVLDGPPEFFDLDVVSDSPGSSPD